jgi:hypothetical protein
MSVPCTLFQRSSNDLPTGGSTLPPYPPEALERPGRGAPTSRLTADDGSAAGEEAKDSRAAPVAPRASAAMMEAALTAVKTCGCCGAVKPLARFLHSKHTADGRTDRCLDCIRAAARREGERREQRRRERAQGAANGTR